MGEVGPIFIQNSDRPTFCHQAIEIKSKSWSWGHLSRNIKIYRWRKYRLLYHPVNQIYKTGNIPDDWLESVFIPVSKNLNPRQFGDFCFISLMYYVLKVFLNIIQSFIRKFLINVRWIMDKTSLDLKEGWVQEKLYLAYKY